MDRKRAIMLWLMVASAITLIAYLVGASWWLAILIGVGLVGGVVGGANWYMYQKQNKLIKHAAQFNIDLKGGKVHPADLRRMYFSGGQARKDALTIAAQAMRCSEQEAEKRLSERPNKQAANQEMAKMQSGGKRRNPRPR